MNPVTAKQTTYCGLFMVTLATLMYEVLLTRIFSVTMWYHFAFVALSVAMFGMTVGAVVVYLFPSFFTQERVEHHLAVSSMLFSVTVLFSFLTHLSIPFITARSIVFAYSIALNYAVLSIPFVFSGICVCLALTRFPQQISRLYAADLAGAALGCLMVIVTLRFTDGPTSVILVALLASMGCAAFSWRQPSRRLFRLSSAVGILLFLFVVGNTIMVNRQVPLLRLAWVKGQLEPLALYEKWNSFSRIAVWGDPTLPHLPFGWGLSSTYPSDKKLRQLTLDIDANASTVLTHFDGNNWDELDYLKYDVTNMVHYLRPNSNVLVVGTGGGRDILSALTFQQKSVVGVEINGDIIRAVNERFGDFTGHLDRDSRVSFVNDEARSYIARQSGKFDIIQISLIDSWAATSAGAFVLAENSLYTSEAWKIFFDHITPNGVLTVSRWYYRDRPGEVYRLVSLAATSLSKLGIADPRQNIVIVRRMYGEDANEPDGIGTMLASREPFSSEDLRLLDEKARALKFEVVLSPNSAIDSTLAEIASGKGLDTVGAKLSLNIASPTDDNPFFFHMLRLRDVFDPQLWQLGATSFNLQAVFVLMVLLITVILLTFLCIVVPLLLTTKRSALRGSFSLFVFFSSIGFGFMLVEISQMQRLNIFLGHPVYGLSVVLFSLLLSSSIGSVLTSKLKGARLKSTGVLLQICLACALVVVGAVTTPIITAFEASTAETRMLVAAGLNCLIGFFMGMTFPLGMKLASSKSPLLTPWLWGINGATSVCASVVAVVISLSWGISTSFWTGLAFYLVALVAFCVTEIGKMQMEWSQNT